MAQRHLPGSTIGIIGSSLSAAVLAQTAGRLGYRVASLVTEEQNPVRQHALWQTVVEDYEDEALKYFGARVDLAIPEKGILSNQALRVLNQHTDLPMSDDLMAITTDRLIEKVYLDTHHILVAPFSMVTNMTDLKEAVEYIGYPCVLKATQRHIAKADDHVILYSENDFNLAEAKLAQTTCLLEAWIPAEKQVSLIVIRNERGEILIYPPFDIRHEGMPVARQVAYPAQLMRPVEEEMRRIAYHLANQLNLRGSLTLKFLVTSAGVMYVNQASIGMNEESMFTIGTMSVSHYEATLRAMFDMALPSLTLNHPAGIALPLTAIDTDKLMIQYLTRTDWGFAIFPSNSLHQSIQGYVNVTGDSLESCRRQIEATELLLN